MKMAYLRDVVSLRLDRDVCVGCGRCLDVCPHGVMAMEGGKIRIAERDACMECGACARNCPATALWVKNGVGCAAGILNSTLGLTSNCCGESQSCCCGDSEQVSPNEMQGKGGVGTMDEKTKELIAIGASVSAHCQPCLSFHAAKARKIGIEECEIREAIAVGHMVEKGAMDAMRQFSSGKLDTPAAAPAGCCGGGELKGKEGKGCCA